MTRVTPTAPPARRQAGPLLTAARAVTVMAESDLRAVLLEERFAPTMSPPASDEHLWDVTTGATHAQRRG